MDDLIKREDAIEAIKGNSYALGDDYMEINGYGAIEDIIALPSADRPQGYWTNDDGAFRCSICGEREDAFIEGWDWEVCGASKFCPSCGADMKGSDE